MDDPLTLAEPDAYVRADVLRRVVERHEGVESPYGQFGTLVAKTRTLFPVLVGVARDRSLTGRGRVADECGIHPARVGPLLRVLGHHEAAVGRPLLPAVVTKADREFPDADYFETVERVPNHPDDVPSDRARRRWLWETQRDAVYRQWAGRDDGRRDERAVTIP